MPPSARVIVSIATIPSRIGLLKPTIDSLLAGNRVPDTILISHPEYCKWEKSGYSVPDFLADSAYCRGIVEHRICDFDWGPGTKLISALDGLNHDDILIVADDDVLYDRRFIEGLVAAQSRNHGHSYSYYTYRMSGLSFGQGCDGYSFYAGNLQGIKEFAERHVKDTPLLYHDDLWVGFFLYMRGIKVRRIVPPDGKALVYEQLLPNDALSNPEADFLKRHNITQQSLPRLFRDNDVSSWLRSRAQIVSAFDWIVRKARNAGRRILPG